MTAAPLGATPLATGGRVHVIGAGLAGLAAAVRLALTGRPVSLYEAGPQAGGRCRSYFDELLGYRIDNGNHLLLTGNRAASRYVEAIGARATLKGPGIAALPFVDLASGARWVLRPNRGLLPFWVLSASRRVPGTRARDYAAALRLRRAAPSASVGDILGSGTALFRALWEPLAVAALNTHVEEASARLFGRVLAETIGRGGGACIPLVPRDGLSETFVDPALATLARHRAGLSFGARLRGIGLDAGASRISTLTFEAGSVAVGAGDAVILAVPAFVAARLVPSLVVPDRHMPIVNAHFRYALPAGEDAPLFAGLVGGTAEWVFAKRGIVSVTVSAADRIVEQPAALLAETLWRDVARAWSLPPDPVPPARVVKERRATFLASPAQLARRPPAATAWNNLWLAGDYTDTGLPATIEGAIRSGFAAARHVLERGHSARARADATGGRHRAVGASETFPEQRIACR